MRVPDDELLTLNAYRFFAGPDGERVLNNLKKLVAYHAPCYDPDLPVENAVFRDGQKNVINFIESIVRDLDDLIAEKIAEISANDRSSSTGYNGSIATSGSDNGIGPEPWNAPSSE